MCVFSCEYDIIQKVGVKDLRVMASEYWPLEKTERIEHFLSLNGRL